MLILGLIFRIALLVALFMWSESIASVNPIYAAMRFPVLLTTIIFFLLTSLRGDLFGWRKKG